MILQHIILNDKDELYYRGKTCLRTDEVICFDTYFNSFSYTKYTHYTIVKNISFSCKIKGRVLLQLCVYDEVEKIVSSEIFENGIAELSIDLLSLPENGFLYPKITALTDDCEFVSGEYTADCCSKEIKACVAICTFKREKYVLHNIRTLQEYKFSNIKKAFVIDNGKTLDIGLNNDFISIIHNKNYGGSGGFTRGMIEAADGGYSHVILMDDDVEFHPQTLELITVFLSLLRDEYSNSWISTAMLPFDKPWEQFELGAHWDGKGSVVHKHKVDIRNQDVLLDNLTNPGVEYGAWWTLAMPVNAMLERGLPYPFFIKFDDVEYGMRFSQDTEIITMNGVAVFHEAFDKKKSLVLDYYNLRNELTVNTIYGLCNTFGALKRFWREAAKQLCLYRYDNMPLVFLAIDHFLGNVDFYLNTDEEALNTQLYSMAPKLIPLKEIDGWREDMRCDDHVADKKITLKRLITLGGHLIPGFMLKKELAAIPLSKTGITDCYGRSSVIQYQLGNDIGLMTRRSVRKLFKYGFITIGVTFRLLFGFSKAKRIYLSRHDELTTFEFWRDHLKI